MKIGIVGMGMVGKALNNWLEKNTSHEVKKRDIAFEKKDSFDGISAAFICIPIKKSKEGVQKYDELTEAINYCRYYTDKIFIRSTVLPGTNDFLKTISMPEFFTARFADSDMERLDVLCGNTDLELVQDIFPGKNIIMMKNTECEIAKYMHNLFGAFKVTYFNIVKTLADKKECDFEQIKKAMSITGFIEKAHTQVPGPDGKLGFGGACFPDNLETFLPFLRQEKMFFEHYFFNNVLNLNKTYRGE